MLNNWLINFKNYTIGAVSFCTFFFLKKTVLLCFKVFSSPFLLLQTHSWIPNLWLTPSQKVTGMQWDEGQLFKHPCPMVSHRTCAQEKLAVRSISIQTCLRYAYKSNEDWTWEIHQWVKCLMCKHDQDLNSTQHPCKSGMWQHLPCNPRQRLSWGRAKLGLDGPPLYKLHWAPGTV